MTENVIEVISLLISVISLISSAIVYINSRRIEKTMMLKEYYNEDNTLLMIRARQEIYKMSELEISDLTSDDTSRALICSYYQFYAELYEKRIISRKEFERIFGNGAKRLFKKLKPYIYARRIRDSDSYADKYQKLVEEYLR